MKASWASTGKWRNYHTTLATWCDCNWSFRALWKINFSTFLNNDQSHSHWHEVASWYWLTGLKTMDWKWCTALWIVWSMTNCTRWSPCRIRSRMGFGNLNLRPWNPPFGGAYAKETKTKCPFQQFVFFLIFDFKSSLQEAFFPMKFSNGNGPISQSFLRIQSTSLECPTLHESQGRSPPSSRSIDLGQYTCHRRNFWKFF